ncbi:pyridoxamine 5'-phosphate oxidase family protein [Myxococcota bacterium]|nr:pyridoxamine 5'-phosphate oxidase family protein [Myxococcota bacterium]
MRRRDKEITDESEVLALLREGEWGVLACAEGADEWPYAVPLNYVWLRGAAWFHGAPAGGKAEAFRRGPRARLVVVRPLAVVPSYLGHPERACPASQYYRSAVVSGRITEVMDLEEKASALNALMERLQPEGGYRPIDPDDPLYRSHVRGTAVWRLEPEAITGKQGLGLGDADARRTRVADFLTERGAPLDAETVEEMRRARPLPERGRGTPGGGD